MQLSPHFSLAELTETNTGLPNVPNGVRRDRLILLADRMEKVRSILGDKPIKITSGYRSPAVNKKVGGVANSDHMSAWVCDFQCQQFGTPYEICKELVLSRLKFDQLICEKGVWVHISFAPRMRQQVLTLPPNSKQYLPGLHG